MNLAASTPLRLARAWLPVVLWMAFTFTASTDLMSSGHTSRFIGPLLRLLIPGISPERLDLAHLVIRKCAHVTEYAILAALFCRALRQGIVPSPPMLKVFFIAVAASALFAASDEFHQSFVGSRTASVHDVLFDVAGAIVGATLFCVGQKFLKRRATPAFEKTVRPRA